MQANRRRWSCGSRSNSSRWVFATDRDSPWVLNGLDLVIPKGARVGLDRQYRGKAARSTAIDLDDGPAHRAEEQSAGGSAASHRRPRPRLAADHRARSPEHLSRRRRTLAENIAFGVPASTSTWKRCGGLPRARRSLRTSKAGRKDTRRRSASEACALSGGQRQRIGIARASVLQGRLGARHVRRSDQRARPGDGSNR